MTSANKFQGYEWVVLVIFVLNLVAGAIALGAPQLGVPLSPVFALALFVITTISVPLANRLETFGAPQGTQVLLQLGNKPGAETATVDTVVPGD